MTAPAGIGDSVEGLHAVEAALEAGRVLSLTVESQRLRRAPYANLARAAEAASVTIEVVEDVRQQATGEAPQGVIARCRPIAPVTLEEASTATDPAALLVFDHVEDPRNLGAAVRSAVAAGFRAIVVSRQRAAPLGPTAFKAAAGALEQVAIAQVGSIPDALKRLGQLRVWRVGLDASSDRSLFGYSLLAEPIALVIGAEGSGLSRLAAERCDALVRIPHRGTVESLNASVASALAVFEVARMRGWVS
jgi:23S rRNA (guanosine2251-2'-O)-methyltransferase